ncbi:MAG: ribosomal RNA small subunit methyltransferase A [Candidatus Tectomicrobia bacterium]|uniref:Ribosomal RNA small subunit methyltransferase A n=1 Tax=Tectimicrobiota bacterium TaxID=2528274 RepID=A0A932HYX6_UNCTE|nr:ribosomal RNA small subunit methyltransferase A [Candidatus Tectomicrobia bacterium]
MPASPKKRFGQHFLRDPAVLRTIIELAGISPGERALEIGAGDGTLTRALLAAGARVAAVELDRDLLPGLQELAARESSLEVIPGDAMKLDYAALPSPQKLIANLPYNIASGLLSLLCGWPERFPLMVVMVQREVAERLAAPPGGKDYGSLTLWVRHRYEAEVCRWVPPGAFRPPPKVDSALVRLRALPRPRVRVPDEETYFRLVRAAFAHRRKTLLNNLKGFSLPGKIPDWPEILARAGVAGGRRAETLDAEDFARILRALPS